MTKLPYLAAFGVGTALIVQGLSLLGWAIWTDPVYIWLGTWVKAYTKGQAENIADTLVMLGWLLTAVGAWGLHTKSSDVQLR